jgi:molybdopterin-containing oxidoreductase family membrane subunit
MFSPTMFDIGDYIFSFGLFFTCFFLFSKYLPVINMAEVKGVIKTTSEKLPKKVSGISKADRLASPAYKKDAE